MHGRVYSDWLKNRLECIDDRAQRSTNGGARMRNAPPRTLWKSCRSIPTRPGS